MRQGAARRRPVFTVIGAVVSLYLLDALLAGVAPGLMAMHLAGLLNVALALNLLQYGTSAWAVWWYVRYARSVLDPQAAQVRAWLGEEEDTR
ncbi:DUF485 domain-containing protein [Streptomyces sp. NPDC050625]|uniref:DUF485 domain-containing protein n=1 Tax=Streptomyces sp. NPDC050625 TaxID=3154629 RepID=UPI003445AE5C